MATQGQRQISGLSSLIGGPQQGPGSPYQTLTQNIPSTFSVYEMGSQNLSAPALAMLIGSQYEAPQGRAYAPPKSYYDELRAMYEEQIAQMAQQANQPQGVDAISQMLAAFQEAMEPSPPPPIGPGMLGGFPTYAAWRNDPATAGRSPQEYTRDLYTTYGGPSGIYDANAYWGNVGFEPSLFTPPATPRTFTTPQQRVVSSPSGLTAQSPTLESAMRNWYAGWTP